MLGLYVCIILSSSHGSGPYPSYHGDVTNQGFRDDYGHALYHQGARGDIKKPKH